LRQMNSAGVQVSLALLCAAILIFASVAAAAGAEPRERALSKLPKNTALDLGPYTCTDVEGEPARQCRRITDFSGLVVDPKRREILAFGGGHASTNYDAINAFDLDTLAWTEKYKPTGCPAMVKPGNYDTARGAWLAGASGPYPRAAARHTVDLLVVPENVDELIVLTNVEGNYRCPGMQAPYTSYDWATRGRIAHYNLNTNEWSFSEASTVLNWPAAEFDPVSGKIVVLGVNGLEIYDPVTRVKTMAIDLRRTYGVKDEKGKILLASALTYNNQLVYFPPNQKMYYFERAHKRVFEVTLNRADFSRTLITRLETSGTPSPHSQPAYAYDPLNGVIGGAVYGSRFYAFDPSTRSWTSHAIEGGRPGTQAFQALDYDPHHNVFIFVTDEAGGRRTWAYRHGGAAHARRD
jgi:hypothetical protein